MAYQFTVAWHRGDTGSASTRCPLSRRGSREAGRGDTPTIEFREGGRYIRFLLGYPSAEDPDYVSTTVAVDSGVFRGGFATNTWLAEWRALRVALAGLDQQVGHEAEVHGDFEDEAAINLTYRMTKQGQLMLQVKIRLWEQDATLRFWIAADQSFLPRWIHAIDQALAQLPAR
jgi:hypothetical protein